MSLPAPIRDLLVGLTEQRQAPAYLKVGAQGAIEAAGGDLAHYDLEPAPLGRSLEQVLPYLVGCLPVEAPLCMPRLQWGAAPPADVHVVPDGATTWVALLDASERTRERRRSQQIVNEGALKREQAEVATRTLLQAQASLDLVVWVPCGGGRFRVAGELPSWFRDLVPGQGEGAFRPGQWSPFLSSFLEEAEVFWQCAEEGETRLRSGPWVETIAGQEQALEAIALRGDGTQLLVLKRLGAEFERQREQLQATREIQLLHEQLKQEMAQRDILIHCIVHDLMGPLTSMRGCLDLLGEDGLSTEVEEELLDVGLTAATTQERMIRDILAAFQAETESLNAFQRDAKTAPDLVERARAVLAVLKPAFTQKKVELRWEASLETARVWGEPNRLERVLSNLLENALRHSPSDAAVTVCLDESEAGVRVRVEDEGPGIQEEQREQLFKKFARGKSGGKIGLGLYFCRITVERWGGSIGCEPLDTGGTRFWFELPRAAEAPQS